MNNNLLVRYLSPFEKEEIKIKVDKEKDVIKKFEEISWYDNIMEIFYSHNYGLRGEEERYVYNDYWYFGIETEHLKSRKLINIVPNFAKDTDFSENDILFSIEYMRPVKVRMSNFAIFFGAPVEKINPNYLTHSKNNTLNQVIRIIKKFISQEFYILDKEIVKIGSIY
ncbi:hypothetical protein [Tenacibaculum ovolyticum]|uniref:hypothetical protein n=1 Tax=Tenacibaculum ovolyticum TaxID=104270 RepID=UPI0003F559CA|nr:hypothetical protein [Tenacibaculum ovolyticum]